MASTPILNITTLELNSVNKFDLHSEALRQVELFCGGIVEDTVDDAPLSPGSNTAYIISNNASGTFLGQEGNIAVFEGGTWLFYTSVEGITVWSKKRGLLIFHDGRWVKRTLTLVEVRNEISFVAKSLRTYIIDGTTSVTLPPGNNGDYIEFIDSGNTFQTNNLLILPDGSETIDFDADYTLSVGRGYLGLIFFGNNWIITKVSSAQLEVFRVTYTVLTGDLTLVPENDVIQAVDPNGSAKDVILPDPPQGNLFYIIVNDSDGLAGNTINIKEEASGATTFTLDDASGNMHVKVIYSVEKSAWIYWTNT